jgi:hypothetical protein
MAKWGSCNFKELEKMRDKLHEMSNGDVDEFCTAVAKELAARLLAKVIKKTPTRKPENCPPGVTGGTLRRGWTAGKENTSTKGNVTGVSGANGYVSQLQIEKIGSEYIIYITNPVMYASYVEFGHRTANHQGWVDGKFMMTISEKELEQQAPRIIQKKLEVYLKEVFK